MSFGPAEIDGWEPYQFAAAWQGWRAANCSQDASAPTEAEYRDALARTIH